MTGAYLRVKRGDEWLNLEVEHLTDKERDEKLGSDPRLIQWLNLVCAKLVEVEVLLNQLVDDGVLSIKPTDSGGKDAK